MKKLIQIAINELIVRKINFLDTRENKLQGRSLLFSANINRNNNERIFNTRHPDTLDKTTKESFKLLITMRERDTRYLLKCLNIEKAF